MQEIREWIEWKSDYKETISWLIANGFTIIKMDSRFDCADAFIARKILTKQAGIEIAITINDEQRDFFEARLFNPKIYNGIPILAPQPAPWWDDPMYPIARARTRFTSFEEFLMDTCINIEESSNCAEYFGEFNFWETIRKN